MRDECQHGSLSRKCIVCERDADIKELRALLGEARGTIDALNDLSSPDAVDLVRRIDTALASAERLPEDAPPGSSARKRIDLQRTESLRGGESCIPPCPPCAARRGLKRARKARGR